MHPSRYRNSHLRSLIQLTITDASQMQCLGTIGDGTRQMVVSGHSRSCSKTGNGKDKSPITQNKNGEFRFAKVTFSATERAVLFKACFHAKFVQMHPSRHSRTQLCSSAKVAIALSIIGGGDTFG